MRVKHFLILVTLASVIFLFNRSLSCYEKPEIQENRENRTNQLDVISDHNFKTALADDPQFIDYIRRELLHPPSPNSYALSNPSKVYFSQFDQSQYASNELLHGMKGGFFVEAGALDGEYLSNTLYFERELGWRGVLIEPHPEAYQNLLQKHRNAYAMNVALSTSSQATEVPFVLANKYHELSHIGKEGIKVKGIPLYSILLALNVKIVDLLSLDIEAFEVKILQTIPWDKVKFRLMCIEIAHIPEGLNYLKKYLAEKGYKFLGVRNVDAWFGLPELLEEVKKT
ncbi:protein Star-like [Palaemon carinicauda]|uniref:protein Star-like n=1 Tax=Palaemon carinicauda TaxID=392227 RepID=UPI0035B5C09E